MSKCRCGMHVPSSFGECLNCERKANGGFMRRRVVTLTGMIKEVVLPPDYGVMPSLPGQRGSLRSLARAS